MQLHNIREIEQNKLIDGFHEAMHFADSDVLFGQDDCLTDEAKKTLSKFIAELTPKLPNEIFETLSPQRIGACMYYQSMGHGTGFWDEADLSKETIDVVNKLFDGVVLNVMGDFKGNINDVSYRFK